MLPVTIRTEPGSSFILIFSAPTGIGWGSSAPIAGIHANLIEKHSRKIVLPYYAMGFNLGMFIGGISAGIFINNQFF